MESLSPTEIQRVYWLNPKWKDLVFHSCKSRRFTSELRKFKLAKFIIGTISTRPNFVYARMDLPDQITKRHMLKTMDRRKQLLSR